MQADPLLIVDRFNNRTDSLRDLLIGKSAFLLGGGPSTKSLDLDQLRQRGIWTMAVNNMAGHFHANSFVFSDPPSKFSDGIWLDPTIMKFCPQPKLGIRGRCQIRFKRDGKFEFRKKEDRIFATGDCPNVWGFGRRTWWEYDDTFFTDEQASWGNGGGGATRTGNPKTLCTMLIAFRLLYYLGVRRIFLVGVDFNMTPEGYSFGQSRTVQAVSGNNSQYQVINHGLCKMVENGVFQKFGLEIFNCNQFSGLRSFPFVEYSQAIGDCLKDFPKVPLDLAGWYEKNQENQEETDDRK